MKKSINMRLDESIIFLVDKLSKEFNTSKTDIVQSAIKLFYKQKKREKNSLIKYAGILNDKEADNIIKSITDNKTSKDFSLDL